METIVVGFLGLSLLMYVLFGGADFGAGIVELTTGRQRSRDIQGTIYKAIGPVWEANHVWLIIVVVILFVGLPSFYAYISTYLHIPLTFMLLGIFARGCAFTFRHYDAIEDNSRVYYDVLFRSSSFLTPLFLGICFGSLLSGDLPAGSPSLSSGENFWSVFIAPWLSIFSISVGLLFCSVCGLLAAAFLVGESETGELAQLFRSRTIQFNMAAVFLGLSVLGLSIHFEYSFSFALTNFFLGWIAAAGVMFALTLWAIWTKADQMLRIAVGAQVTVVYLGWATSQYPIVVYFRDYSYWEINSLLATQATINSLGVAIIVASLLVVPALIFLLVTFKYRSEGESNEH